MRYAAAIIGFVIALVAAAIISSQVVTPSAVDFMKRNHWAHTALGLAIFAVGLLGGWFGFSFFR
jgi:cytochrome c oxidase assembly factor CtaG